MLLSRKIPTPIALQIRKYQVTVLGAANEVGQSLCLFLRTLPVITKLVIHDDLQETAGIAMDIAHVPSERSIIGYYGDDNLENALMNSDLVIATGGATLKPGVTMQSYFSTNTAFIRSIGARIGRTEPMPFVGIVTEPINSMVPMAAEIIRNHGYYDEKKLFGITTIDALRAQSLYASDYGLNPNNCYVPVIGGHSDKTTVPLLSHATPPVKFDESRVHNFTSNVRKADTIVTNAKNGLSPTLSVAYSVMIFVRQILEALQGRPTKVNAFVENNDYDTSFFSGLVTVTEQGWSEMQRYNNLSNYESQMLHLSKSQLKKDVSKGKKILEMTY